MHSPNSTPVVSRQKDMFVACAHAHEDIDRLTHKMLIHNRSTSFCYLPCRVFPCLYELLVLPACYKWSEEDLVEEIDTRTKQELTTIVHVELVVPIQCKRGECTVPNCKNRKRRKRHWIAYSCSRSKGVHQMIDRVFTNTNKLTWSFLQFDCLPQTTLKTVKCNLDKQLGKPYDETVLYLYSSAVIRACFAPPFLRATKDRWTCSTLVTWVLMKARVINRRSVTSLLTPSELVRLIKADKRWKHSLAQPTAYRPSGINES